MAWKKALFLGGAVLLLAACSDAAAPTSLRDGGPAAAAKSSTTETALPNSDLNFIGGDDCRSGYYVRVGDRDVCLTGTSLE